MDYFNDVFTTFRDLEQVSFLSIFYISDFMKNNLICILKINKGLTGLELHEGE